LRLRSQLNDILAKHTGKSADRIALDTDRDFFMTALEAKEYGIVDEILNKQVTEEK
jgi:ATP-dependent Clp protease protease subunit